MKRHSIRLPVRTRWREGSPVAFTLVELLTAIAIIALLAGLAFPALSRVHARSMQLVCTSNLRQLGQVFLTYAGDNNGTLPASTLNDRSLTAGSSWSLMLMNYMGMRFPSLNQKTPFLCPAALDTFPNHQAVRTYAMNYQNLPTVSSIAPDRGWSQQSRLSWHTKPAQTILLLDARGTVSQGSSSGDFNLSLYPTVVDWRHDNGLNGLFIDGHVESFKKTDTARLEQDINNFAR